MFHHLLLCKLEDAFFPLENWLASVVYMRESLTSVFIVIGWLIVTMILWLLALYNTGESTPEWLLRTQQVCFGTTETGLPDAKGWLMLTLAPLSFLLAILVSMGSDIKSGYLRLVKSLPGKSLILVLSVLLLAECAWATKQIRKGIELSKINYANIDSLSLPDNYPITNRPAPEIDLIDQHGKQITLDKLKGRTLILTFAFAHCKTICPAVVQTTQTSLENFSAEDTALLIMTLDPWRDTPKSLPSMAKKV